MRRLLKHALLVVALVGAGLFALPAGPASAGYWQEEVGIRNQGGRAEYFKLDSSRHLLHRWEQTPYQGDYVAWRPLSGILSSGIGVIQNDNGTLGVFGRADGGDLDYVHQLTPGGDWSGWTSFSGPLEAFSGVNACGHIKLIADVHSAERRGIRTAAVIGQRTTQRAHGRVQLLACGRGRIVPDQVDQLLDADRPAGA